MKYLFLVFFGFFACIAAAQTTDGLVAYYPFDNLVNLGEDLSGNGDDATLQGMPGDTCGVLGRALFLDGLNDEISFTTLDVDLFRTANFTISFYFKPAANAFGNRILFSKRDDCSSEHSFAMRYNGTSRFLEIMLSENPSKAATFSNPVNAKTCWQHICLVRDGNRQILYINGVEIKEIATNSRIDLSNNSIFQLSRSPCLGMGVSRFTGFIDELRIYNRDLREEEVEELYLSPDHIINQDTLIFVGQSVSIKTSKTCSNQVFRWTPVDGVSNAFLDNPTITPEESTLYTLIFNDGTCIAQDSILITVVDPDEVDCAKVFLPNAFTPNSDGKNDDFGISNPFVIEELISFEIFDRWGGRVFETADKQMKWDGSFDGSEMNPGVLLYRVRFKCNGQELVDVGSFTLIR